MPNFSIPSAETEAGMANSCVMDEIPLPNNPLNIDFLSSHFWMDSYIFSKVKI